MTLQTFILLLITGILAGVLSGVAGIGGGILIVPLLVFLLGFSQLNAQGTSLAVLLLPSGIMSVIIYYKQGFINWKFALIIALGFIVGGYIGSNLALKINQNIIRKVFSVILILISLKLMLKK